MIRIRMFWDALLTASMMLQLPNVFEIMDMIRPDNCCYITTVPTHL